MKTRENRESLRWIENWDESNSGKWALGAFVPIDLANERWPHSPITPHLPPAVCPAACVCVL